MPQDFSQPQLSVVLPSFQEEENLRLLLPRLISVLGEITPCFEIIVVDTLPPMDATSTVCKKLGVRYVPRKGGNAFGNAVNTGIQEAAGVFAVFMDADGSHSPEFIRELFAHREFDVVIASRYVANGMTDNTLLLVLMSRVLNLTYRWVLGIDCKDISNSFRLYHTADLKSLTLKCSNFDVVEEILLKLKRQKHGLRIKELPFTFKRRMFGTSKRNLFIFMMSYFITLIRLRFFVQ